MDKVPLPTERSLDSLAASAALATGLQDRRAISLLTRPMHAPEGDSVRSGVRTWRRARVCARCDRQGSSPGQRW